MNTQDVDCLVGHWRGQREQLSQSLKLRYFSDIKHLKPPSPSNSDAPEQQLSILCEKLMDYICTGHFEVYEKLLRQSRLQGSNNIKQIKGIYHRIESSTDQALSFNDKYDSPAPLHTTGNDALSKDIDRLNHSLCTRFDLEERLVEIANDDEAIANNTHC